MVAGGQNCNSSINYGTDKIVHDKILIKKISTGINA